MALNNHSHFPFVLWLFHKAKHIHSNFKSLHSLTVIIQLGEEGVSLTYRLQSIIKESQDRNSRQKLESETTDEHYL